ncbi:nucleus accumbens-associated 1 isoform X1 [Brachionus plicatilis]|uniref:Nucleus accumbens-associated 1 isoform X1 n=1 Tax=Brachionus plicatilis TaxID=10195 RepID=A0A3M7T6C6_BRAPC|nr:nucleus accumbens-associated 1 isoform X1 [Brachionus plicatilis]
MFMFKIVNWTGRCQYKEEPKVSKEKLDSAGGPSEKVRLVPGYDVFISTNDLNACNDDRGSATRLLRNLMDVFFDKSTLAKSSINGTGRITNTLDKHVISALFAYVKNRYADVPHSQLTRAATDKCVQTRRNFRKKIKAAQSYFGMFPSLMMARPPQLPQASENSV